jgi:hypothetical protein
VVSIPDLSPEAERRLFALLIAHDRMDGYLICQSCGYPHPCPTHEDARRQLTEAGVSLDDAATIWGRP